jgi:hypothetical protein
LFIASQSGELIVFRTAPPIVDAASIAFPDFSDYSVCQERRKLILEVTDADVGGIYCSGFDGQIGDA